MIFADGALEHVLDTKDWHFIDIWHWHIPLSPTWNIKGQQVGLITKYSLLMIAAAALIAWIYIPLAKKIKTGEAPTGRFWNFFEAILAFVRDEIAKPYIGKEADKYVPTLWTIFLFVLFCNLFGMIPFMGSPTASVSVTGVLALFIFIFMHYNIIVKYGFKAHFLAFCPPMEMSIFLKVPLLLMLWPIEFLGLIIKCSVLAVRLFANMFAGHIVLATILLFIPAMRNASAAMFTTVSISAWLGVVALSFLELFVALLQAYLFVFLTALFFGGVLEHAEHAAHGGGHDDHGHGADDHGYGAANEGGPPLVHGAGHH